MQGFNLPYQPILRNFTQARIYFQNYDPDLPASWGETVDFEIYRHFVIEGRTTPRNPYMGMMQALHDNAISEATTAFIQGRRVVAIIGDHRLARDSATYRSAASWPGALPVAAFSSAPAADPVPWKPVTWVQPSQTARTPISIRRYIT